MSVDELSMLVLSSTEKLGSPWKSIDVRLVSVCDNIYSSRKVHVEAMTL